MKEISWQIKLLVGFLVLVTACCLSRSKGLEAFEDVRRVDSYLPNYVVEVQRRCLPGETEDGRYCVKQGCPQGMERGTGSGSQLCYPKCIDGYDSNGMSRCYRKCPAGFKQDKTTCENPGHEFTKDVIPCKGCIDQPLLGGDTEKLQAALLEPAAVVMTNTDGYPATVVAYPAPPQSDVFWGDATTPVFITEYFDGVATPPPATTKVTVDLRAQRIDDPNSLLPCPRGYTLSGDHCHENCPPHYRDTMDGKCVKKPYTIDRDSYDRGAGVPYITRRSKWDWLHHT